MRGVFLRFDGELTCLCSGSCLRGLRDGASLLLLLCLTLSRRTRFSFPLLSMHYINMHMPIIMQTGA